MVSLRQPVAGDAAIIVNNRDPVFHRFMGEGAPDPAPTAVIQDSAGNVVGWIDYATDHDWLADGHVNIGYTIFAGYRRLGFASRALSLLLTHLQQVDDVTTATLLIDPANTASLALADRAGFRQQEAINGELLFCRSV